MGVHACTRVHARASGATLRRFRVIFKQEYSGYIELICPHTLHLPYIELSFIFLLTGGASSMQIAGKGVFQYVGAGSGCTFHASLWHSSIMAEQGTLKLAVFLNKTNLNHSTVSFGQLLSSALQYTRVLATVC